MEFAEKIMGYIQDAENVTLASKKSSESVPFIYMGLDYLGTFYVEGNPSKKYGFVSLLALQYAQFI